MIPGLSRSSNSFLFFLEVEEEDTEDVDRTRIHCSDRVTPGVLELRARFLPRMRLINADCKSKSESMDDDGNC